MNELMNAPSRFEHFPIVIDDIIDISGIGQSVIFTETCRCEFDVYEELIRLILSRENITSQNILAWRKLYRFWATKVLI